MLACVTIRSVVTPLVSRSLAFLLAWSFACSSFCLEVSCVVVDIGKLTGRARVVAHILGRFGIPTVIIDIQYVRVVGAQFCHMD